jgi:hypothetical protein
MSLLHKLLARIERLTRTLAMEHITSARCTFTTLHCLSVQRVWSVLIFLLTFFIKEKSEAPPARRSYKTNLVAKPTKQTRPARASYKTNNETYISNHFPKHIPPIFGKNP